MRIYVYITVTDYVGDSMMKYLSNVYFYRTIANIIQ